MVPELVTNPLAVMVPKYSWLMVPLLVKAAVLMVLAWVPEMPYQFMVPLLLSGPLGTVIFCWLA